MSEIRHKKRKIIYVTGSRADYGVMYPTLFALMNDSDLELSLVVTGAHSSDVYGNSIKEIEKDGLKISAMVDMRINKRDNCEMAQSLGYGVIGMAAAFKKIKPDIVLLEGDRGEMLAAAIAAAHMNIPIVHTSGGDVSGSIDNSIRKAITDFSHIHLVNTKEAEKRLLKRGEEHWRIKKIGSLGLDLRVLGLEKTEEIIRKFDLNPAQKIVLIVQHPVTSESEKTGLQMQKTLSAVMKLKCQTLLIYPNADAGSKEAIKIIEQYQKKGQIKVFKTLPRKDFLGLMSVADLMIGNSSSGLVETSMFKLPTINIGARQKGRSKPTNVFNVGNDAEVIYKKAWEILSGKIVLKSIQTVYGDENTTQKIINVLRHLKINDSLLNKYGK